MGKHIMKNVGFVVALQVLIVCFALTYYIYGVMALIASICLVVAYIGGYLVVNFYLDKNKATKETS
jgi:hypothetical protein